jgi:hypothetical protein
MRKRNEIFLPFIFSQGRWNSVLIMKPLSPMCSYYPHQCVIFDMILFLCCFRCRATGTTCWM